MSKNRLANLYILSATLFLTAFGILLWHESLPTTAATANCYGQAGTHTAIAPNSVYYGKSFKLSSITGSANSNIATVKSTKITYLVTGATPTSPTGSWNGGPVNGDYTSHYPDLTLTASGAIGSKVTVSISSIEANVTIAGTDTAITCSVANGQLTANSPGQSLVLASVKIVAPPTTSSGSTSTSGNTNNQSTTKSTNNKSSKNKTAYSETQTTDQVDAGTQVVEITVVDHKGQPVQGANVVVDSLPAVQTDSAGNAQIKDLVAGSHDLSVTAKGQTVTQTFNASGQPAQVLGVNVKIPAPSHKLRNIAIGIVAGIVALIIGGSWLIMKRLHHTKAPAIKSLADDTAEPVKPPTEANMVQPSLAVKQAPPSQPIHTDPPKLNND